MHSSPYCSGECPCPMDKYWINCEKSSSSAPVISAMSRPEGDRQTDRWCDRRPCSSSSQRWRDRNYQTRGTAPCASTKPLPPGNGTDCRGFSMRVSGEIRCRKVGFLGSTPASPTGEAAVATPNPAVMWQQCSRERLRLPGTWDQPRRFGGESVSSIRFKLNTASHASVPSPSLQK